MSNALKSYRERKRLSQKDVAALIGVSRQMVSFLENGKRCITGETAVLIEQRLGINRVLLRPDLFRRRAA